MHKVCQFNAISAHVGQPPQLHPHLIFAAANAANDVHASFQLSLAKLVDSTSQAAHQVAAELSH